MSYKGEIIHKRLIQYVVDVVELSESLTGTRFGIIMGDQLIRASTSASLNFGEAISTHTRNELVYKLRLVLKEVREANTGLMILAKKPDIGKQPEIRHLIKESDELCAMLYASIRTALQPDKNPQN